jgi:hypothetical protein
MKKIFLIGLLALGLAHKSEAQLISNGNFEFWPSGCPYNISPNSWTNFSTQLGPDQAGNCAGTVLSVQGNSHMNLVWHSAIGLIEGAKQIVQGLIIGRTYHLNFYAINDQGLYSYGDPAFLEIYLDSTVIFTTPELVSGGSWTSYSIQFTANSNSKTIGFKIKPGSTGTSGSVGIDSVTLFNPNSSNNLVNDHIINIYPNPFHSTATIQSAVHLNQASIVMYHAVGQQVNQWDHISGQNISISRENLPQGLYFICIKEGNKILAIEKVNIVDR